MSFDFFFFKNFFRHVTAEFPSLPISPDIFCGFFGDQIQCLTAGQGSIAFPQAPFPDYLGGTGLYDFLLISGLSLYPPYFLFPDFSP